MPIDLPRQEVRDAAGRTIAYVVAADVLETMNPQGIQDIFEMLELGSDAQHGVQRHARSI